MDALFTLNDPHDTDPAITTWWGQHDGALADIALACFQVMKSQGDDVREIMHDGAPTACIGRYPFAYVNIFKTHVNVGFFYGAQLQDPDGILEGSGKRMRHVKLRPGEILFEQVVYPLIFQACADIRQRISLLEQAANQPA